MEHSRNGAIEDNSETGPDVWKLPMSTLSGIIQEGYSNGNFVLNEGRDIEGLLFGKSTTVYSSEHSDQNNRAQLLSKTTSVVMSYLVTGSCCSFYSNIGAVDVQKVSDLVQVHKRTDLSLMGIFVLRKATPLKPSIRERKLMNDLYEKVLKPRQDVFSAQRGCNPALLVLSTSYNSKGQDEDPYMSFHYQLFTGIPLAKTKINVPNLGGQLTAYEQLSPLGCGSTGFYSFLSEEEEVDPNPVVASVKHVEGLCLKKLAQVRDLIEMIEEKEDEIRTKIETLQQKKKHKEKEKEKENERLSTLTKVDYSNSIPSMMMSMENENSATSILAPPVSVSTPPSYSTPTDNSEKQKQDRTTTFSQSPTY